MCVCHRRVTRLVVSCHHPIDAASVVCEIESIDDSDDGADSARARARARARAPLLPRACIIELLASLLAPSAVTALFLRRKEPPPASSDRGERREESS